MSADPKANSNDAPASKPTLQPQNDAPASNNSNQSNEKKGNFIDRIANSLNKSIKKGAEKMNEMEKKFNAEVNDAIVKIDKTANEVAEKYGKEAQKLNDKTTAIAQREVPENMVGLLVQATNSLDSQLKIIQQQLNRLKEKHINLGTLQQLRFVILFSLFFFSWDVV